MKRMQSFLEIVRFFLPLVMRWNMWLGFSFRWYLLQECERCSAAAAAECSASIRRAATMRSEILHTAVRRTSALRRHVSSLVHLLESAAAHGQRCDSSQGLSLWWCFSFFLTIFSKSSTQQLAEGWMEAEDWQQPPVEGIWPKRKRRRKI